MDARTTKRKSGVKEMNKRYKKEIIGGCITISLLAGVLVGGNEYHNLIVERNGLHDSLKKLESVHKEDAKSLEDYKNKQQKLQQQLDQLQKQTDSLLNQNRSLNQEVDSLQKQLKQAKENQWLSFKATYYDANESSTGKQPGDKDYGVTASGRMVVPGVTVAVDPSIIPLGSWIEVMYPDGTVEKRRADDTGSAIIGRHIDIYVPQVTSSMGVDHVKVRMLSKPNESI